MTEQQRARLMAFSYLDLREHRELLRDCPPETARAWYADPRPAELADACARFEDELVSAALGEPIEVGALPAEVAAHVRRQIGAGFNRLVFAK